MKLIHDDTDPIVDNYYALVAHRAKEVKEYVLSYKTNCEELDIEPWFFKVELIRAFPQYERMIDAILVRMRDEGDVDFDDHKPLPTRIYCRAATKITRNPIPYNTEPILHKENRHFPTAAVSENYFRG